MDIARTVREARRSAGLSQAALAARAGTSQATISSYERGHKQPSVETLVRLLASTGRRLALAPESRAPLRTEEALSRSGRVLVDVMALAEALPTRHDPELRFPRLAPRAG